MFFLFFRLGEEVGTADGRPASGFAGGWAIVFFFGMVRLLLLYILINKWGFNSLRENKM